MRVGISRKIGSDHGFTIAEVLVSLTILFTVVVSAMGALQFSRTSSMQSARRDEATNLGNQIIEQVRNLPYDDVGTRSPGGEYGDPPGVIITPQVVDDYTITTEISYARDTSTGRATYKNVEVTVTWQDPLATDVRLETAVMGKSELTNTGDVIIQVLDKDTSEPVPGVRVVIDPASGGNRTVNTNAQGESFFGYVPTGALGVAITKAGYLIDVSPLSSAQVQADTLTSLTVYAQVPSTGIIRVLGSDGSPIEGATVRLTDTRGNAYTQVTPANGQAVFNNLLIAEYTAAVTASGRIPGSGVLNITQGGQTVSKDIVLADPNQLTVIALQNSNGMPLVGASIRVQGPSATSGGASSAADIAGSPTTSASSGAATFDLPASGYYKITVSKSGYVSQTRTFYATSSGVRTETLRLDTVTPGSLWVRVLRTNGNPRNNVSVIVQSAATGYYGTFSTNSQGNVFVNGLLPGDYDVTAGGRQRSVTISAGQQTYLEVRY